MKNSELDKKRNKFIASIIESIKMNVNEFMQNLADGEKYEITIYEWSIDLFDEGKSIKDAIKTVQARRMSVIINSAHISSNREDLIVLRNHEMVMKGLKSQSMYSNLNEIQKTSIQKSIDDLVNSKLYYYPKIIELTLKVIKEKFISKPSEINETKKSKSKLDMDNNKSTFISEFKRYLHPKIILNGTILQSSQLS